MTEGFSILDPVQRIQGEVGCDCGAMVEFAGLATERIPLIVQCPSCSAYIPVSAAGSAV